MMKLNSSGNVVQKVPRLTSRPQRMAVRIAQRIFKENFEKYQHPALRK